MKIETEHTKTFEPIRLTITIETEDELKGLLGRMDLSSVTISQYTCFTSDEEFQDLWAVLNQLYSEHIL